MSSELSFGMKFPVIIILVSGGRFFAGILIFLMFFLLLLLGLSGVLSCSSDVDSELLSLYSVGNLSIIGNALKLYSNKFVKIKKDKCFFMKFTFKLRINEIPNHLIHLMII